MAESNGPVVGPFVFPAGVVQALPPDLMVASMCHCDDPDDCYDHWGFYAEATMSEDGEHARRGRQLTADQMRAVAAVIHAVVHPELGAAHSSVRRPDQGGPALGSGRDPVPAGDERVAAPTVDEGACAASPDDTHCSHWWDGEPCHYCGFNGGEIGDGDMSDGPMPSFDPTHSEETHG